MEVDEGQVRVVERLIAPLYDGKTASELDALLAGQSAATAHDIVQNYWKTKHTGADFDMWWRKSLHDGWIEGTTFQPRQVSLKSMSFPASSPTPDQNALEIVFRPDPSIYDGRFANNGWLQELPRPLTKITWDNVALVSANTAKKLGLAPQAYEERDHGRECYVDTIKVTLRNQTIAKTVP